MQNSDMEPTKTSSTLLPSQIPSQIDLLISLHLHLWSALTIAIQNAWGTSSPQISEDKRDWLAGAVSDLLNQKQLRDVEDLEDVLEQVMSDEFEVVVDDGTLEEVAHKIWKGVERLKQGDGREVQDLMREWEKRKGKKINAVAGPQDEENHSSEDEDEDEEWNGFEDNGVKLDQTDIDMDEAPMLVDASKSRKAEPEIDEDGFTKVVGKKKR